MGRAASLKRANVTKLGFTGVVLVAHGPGGTVVAAQRGSHRLAVVAPQEPVHEPTKLAPHWMPLPEGWVIDGLSSGEDGWFMIVCLHATAGIRLEARHLAAPDVVVARIDAASDGDVRMAGPTHPWALLPSLVDVSRRGMPLLMRTAATAPAQLIHQPPDQTFAHLMSGLEEYGLSRTVLPDRRHVVIQSAHHGGRFVVWDALDKQVVTEAQVEASYPLEFASELTPDALLWVASSDTLFELDPSSWELRFSARLRLEPNGSFVGWLMSAKGGQAVVIGWSRRRMEGNLEEPDDGDVLILDTERLNVERVASFPTWTSAAVVNAGAGTVVAETGWHPYELLQVSLRPEPHPLYAPRDRDDHDWR